MLLAYAPPMPLLKLVSWNKLCFSHVILYLLFFSRLRTRLEMYDKTLLAFVVAICGIAMFINSGSFHNIYGRKLSYLTTNSGTATIYSTSVGGSTFKGVSNSSISTGQSSSSAISNSIQAGNNNTNKVVISVV